MLLTKATFITGSVLVILLAVTIHILLSWWRSIPGIDETPAEEYDYVIVGAGTAGCVLARRLAENSTNRILVIEAGESVSWISSIPLLAPALQVSSADWGFKTVPQHEAQWGMENQQSSWPRGKALGGSSSINYLIHTWGSKSDFDSWKERGCTGWDFEDVRHYFQKSESFRTFSGIQSDHRGANGPLPVTEFNGATSPLARAFLEGAASLGVQNGDLNGQLENGAMLCQSNIKNGKRWSVFEAYLRPVIEQPNVDVVTDALVTRIIFENKTAVGVELLKMTPRLQFYIRARQEVILSAGAIGSPHLLLLSGVGPRKDLEKLQIPVVADLPGVGRRLQDHLNVPMYFHVDVPVTVNTAKARSLREIWKYFFHGRGYLSSSGIEAIARAPISGDNSTRPKLFFMLFNMGSVNEDMFTKIANFKKQAFLESFPDTHNDSKEGFILLTSCIYPRSEGELFLVSSSPFVPPDIDPHYLENKEDVKCYIKGMKMAARLGSTKFLRELGARLHLPAYVNCAQHQQSLDSDDYLECWLRTGAITGYHPLGTCSIGAHDDPLAVLDSELRVRKVHRLRVVDASAIPQEIAGTPHAVVIMIAEKAADMIRSTLFQENQKISGG